MGQLIMGIGSYGDPVRRGNANTITIGNYTSISSGVVFDSGFNHDHSMISTYPFYRLYSNVQSNILHPGDISIGSDCWIGEDAVIMAGTKIDNGAVIGARSVVTKNTTIGPYEVWAGVPAKYIKHRFEKKEWPFNLVKRLQQLKWWDLPENEIREIAPLLMSNKFEELFKLYNL